MLASISCILAFAAAQAPPLQYLHIRPGFQISTFAYGVERARQLAISKANPFIVYTGSNEAPVRWAPSARSQFSRSACPAADVKGTALLASFIAFFIAIKNGQDVPGTF